MCVNDVITCGANPLYFLDYISTQRLDGNVADIMVGVLKGCEIAGMDLLGGETAEHPRQLHYDMAGFCTGIVEKKKIIDGSAIKPSDRVIGLASSGLHSNGYSMVNYLLTRHQIFYADHPELLTPTATKSKASIIFIDHTTSLCIYFCNLPTLYTFISNNIHS